MENLNYVVTEAEAGERLDAYLAHQTQCSRTLIQEQVKQGQASLNGKPVTKPATKLSSGDKITFTLKESEPLHLEPVPAELDILFEDEFLLVINKPQGLVVHPATGHRGVTLVHHLLHHFQSTATQLDMSSLRPGIVHRLDKGTSGVLLIAKNRHIQDSLSQQFKNRSVKKTYECLVWGQIVRPGALKNPIGRDRVNRKKMSSKSSKSRTAETHLTPLEVFRSFTHLQVNPLTGRTHQIRVHLSEFGHSIVGDPLYGKGVTQKRLENLSDPLKETLHQVNEPFLHAQQLQFTHPISYREITCQAPPPKLFTEMLLLLQTTDRI